MMPDDWFEQLKGFDALFYGAVGWPNKVPDPLYVPFGARCCSFAASSTILTSTCALAS